jgi:hypothetical protein
MFSGITGLLQKQGNTEAVPVGRKSVGVTFTSYPEYTTIFNNSQYIKNIDILLFIVKLRKNQGLHPVVTLVTITYRTGVKLTRQVMQTLETPTL